MNVKYRRGFSRILLAAFLFAVALRAPADTVATSDKSIFNLRSEWTNQDGRPFALAELKGRPSVVAMAYTSCSSSCPLIIEQMKKIDRTLGSKGESAVRFVLFSFDSQRDTPGKLKEFARSHQLAPDRWVLLNGNTKAVRELAAVLGVRYRKDAGGEFAHSNLLTLLDAAGVPAFQQSGLGNSAEEMASKVRELTGRGSGK